MRDDDLDTALNAHPPLAFSEIREEGQPGETTSPELQLTRRWLAFLVVETGLLLVFQIVVGLLSNSLSLIADSAHSGADLVSYSLNYFAECQKASAASTGQSSECLRLRSQYADLLGSLISTVMLCAATWWAAWEAMGRLSSVSSDDFKAVGPALLAFSIISTAANVLTLWMYRYWGSAPGAVAAPGQKEMTTAAAASEVPPPPPEIELPPVPLGRDRGAQREPRKGARLKLCAEFAKPREVCSALAGSADCRCNDGSIGGSGSVQPQEYGMAGLFHRLVHPGCTGHHAAEERGELSLNVSSAMLHLVSDVMRGIIILVVAVLIEANVITEVGKADAICALLVALFVGLGSVELLRRMAKLMWQRAPEEEEEDEAEGL